MHTCIHTYNTEALTCNFTSGYMSVIYIYVCIYMSGRGVNVILFGGGGMVNACKRQTHKSPEQRLNLNRS